MKHTVNELRTEIRLDGQGLTEHERKVMGHDHSSTEELFESCGREDVAKGKMNPPYQGKRSDEEVWINFDSAEDARVLYDFFVENKLLIPGEIVLNEEEGQFSVHFASSVVVTKPEYVLAAIDAYKEIVYEDVEGEVQELVNEILSEAKMKFEPKSPGFNPFHDKKGKFTSKKKLKRTKGGSWSDGAKRRLKVTKKGFGSTKRPCGREARPKDDIRCWDGKEGAGAKLARVLKKKVKKESLDAADMAFLKSLSEGTVVGTTMSGFLGRLTESKNEKSVAKKMQAKGYTHILLVPGHDPLYSKSVKMAAELMRTDLKNIKGIKVVAIDEYLGK